MTEMKHFLIPGKFARLNNAEKPHRATISKVSNHLDKREIQLMRAKLRSAKLIPERGFSLFEVLITVVVISIGLLGLAGLQFAGLRAANNAQEHTLAVYLIQDIEERIHANRLSNYGSINLSNADTITGTSCDAR